MKKTALILAATLGLGAGASARTEPAEGRRDCGR